MSATAGGLGALALAGRKLDELVVSGVRDLHGAVADRAWWVPDRLGGAVGHRVHDVIATEVYAGVGASLRAGASTLDVLDRSRALPRLEDHPAGRTLLATVNGLVGDRLRDEGSPLALEAAVRHRGRDVTPDREGLAGAFPRATGCVVVFVHGLCESEQAWHRERRPGRSTGAEEDAVDAPGDYGEVLAAEGWTPVHVRLNTGLPVAENGAALSAVMARVTQAWPTEVRRIALVGHSMGGLVIRASGAVAGPESGWTALVTDVVTLGTPHLGAPLERLVAGSTPWLGRLRESAPFGRILEHRSQGILDLRRGLAPDVRRFDNARYHLVAGSLTGSPRHPVALGVGDLLVQPRSALARPQSGPEMFPGADLLHVPGADHFALLNHGRVAEALRRWLVPG